MTRFTLHDDLAFLRYVRENRHIGYGRMIQIIAAEWDEAQPMAGLYHTTGGRPTKRQTREHFAIKRSDPLGALAGWKQLDALTEPDE